MNNNKVVLQAKENQEEQIVSSHRAKMPNDSHDGKIYPVKKAEHGRHPNSLANLKPYEKGQSGNPGGRSTKYQKLADALLPYAEKRETKHKWNDNLEKFENIESEDNYREEVLKMIWKRARNGDIKYVELLAQLGCLDEK
jgi:hypothetical protein|tara:strand:- start:824 stop:1243 length:420 start_codon:yes stop_codon:yes gene_type:complete